MSVGAFEEIGGKIVRENGRGKPAERLCFDHRTWGEKWINLHENLKYILNSKNKTITIPNVNSGFKLLETSNSKY